MKTKAQSHTGTGAAKNRTAKKGMMGYMHGGIVKKGNTAKSFTGTGAAKKRSDMKY